MINSILQTKTRKQRIPQIKLLFLLPVILMGLSEMSYSQTHIAWQKSIGTEYADKAISVFQDLHGNTIVVGKEPHLDFTGNLRDYMMLTKLDHEGHQLWKTYHDVALETFSLPVDYSVGTHFYAEDFGDTLLTLIISISGRTLQYRVLDQSGDYYFYEDLPAPVVDINPKNEKAYAITLCSHELSCYGPDSLIVQSFDPTPDSFIFNPILWTFEMKQNLRTTPIQGHYDFNVQDIRLDTDGGVFLLVQIERWDFQFCTDCGDVFIDAWCEIFKFDKHGVLLKNSNLKTSKAVVSSMRFIQMYDDNMLIQINDINAAGTKVLTSVYRVSKELATEKKYDLDLLYPYVQADKDLNIFTVRNVFDDNDPNVKGLSDIIVSSYTRDGMLRWKQYFGGSNWEFPQGLALSDDGGIFFLANSESTDFDVAENFGSQDIWLVKLLEGGSTGIENPNVQGSLSIYPNPCSDHLSILTADRLNIGLYDMHGRRLIKQQIDATDDILDLKGLPAGTYVIKGVDEKQNVFTSRVVKM